MVDANHARICGSFDEVLRRVDRAYPHTRREGSAGGWSWTLDGEIVAASAFIETPPADRHWLALRPKG
jgi:hypothetical protein